MIKNGVFEKLDELFSNIYNNYHKMTAYYKKNWIHNKFINYTEISKDEYINRTINFQESFHGNKIL